MVIVAAREIGWEVTRNYERRRGYNVKPRCHIEVYGSYWAKTLVEVHGLLKTLPNIGKGVAA